MPQIELTIPRGALPDESIDSVMAEATTTLLRWEGAPVDSPGAREVSWGFVHEADRAYHAGSPAPGDVARYRFDVTVPIGALNEEKKNGLVADLTRLVLSAEGTDFDSDPGAGMRVWVLVHEVPEGNWGGAGRTWKLREIAALVSADAPAPAEAVASRA